MINWRESLQLEHQVAEIITKQEINGVQFDSALAEKHIQYLDEICNDLYRKIRPYLSKEVVNLKELKKVFKKDGSYNRFVVSYFNGEPSIQFVSGPFTRVSFQEPNLSSDKKLKEQLLRLGWKPLEWNYKKDPKTKKTIKPLVKTSPKISEESLESIKGGEFGKNLKLWITYKHRRSQIKSERDNTKGWLNNPRLKVDGRLTAGANTCGAPTGRMKHRIVVNVPKAEDHVIFGKEMRQLFTVKDGYVMVGHDASGIENRMLASRMNDPELTKEIIEGDFHTKVWKTINKYVKSRSQTKNIEYAFFYGAGDTKLGKMVDDRNGLSIVEAGKTVRALIMKGLPSLGSLIERVQEAAERGYLKGLDGRKLWVRSTHSALNLLLQSDAAIVMKKSMVLLDEWVKQEGLDVKKVIDMHDEAQAEVHPNDAERYGQLAVESIKEAGRYFNLNVPLDGEFKIGKNWAETH